MKNERAFFIACLFIIFDYGLQWGGAKQAETPPATPAPSTETAAETPKEEPAEPEAEPVDLGGRVIKVASWWDLKPAGTTAGEKARLEKIAEIEKKYNCKIEFVNVPFEEYMNKFTTSVLAGEPFADIVRWVQIGIAGYYERADPADQRVYDGSEQYQ